MAGLNIVRVPYKGGSGAVLAVLAQEVFLTFATAGSAMPLLQSGKLKALAVTSTQPSPLFPGLPTVAASGLPGYESMSTNAMFAPTGTPAAIITRLNQEIVTALNATDIKEKFFRAGVEAAGSSPEQLTLRMKTESARMGKIIKEAGIRAD
jgi:tripartite-type tricarboxylate transporter receptor subunit TctC